jgi:hypothetical protein
VPAHINRYGYKLSALLPYTWLVQAPGFADLRVAARFVILGTLPAALLAGFGLQALGKMKAFGWAPMAVALTFCALDLGSPMAFRGPITQSKLYAPIKADHSSSIVVDVPLLWLTGTRYLGTPTNYAAMLRATQHRHPIAYGVVGRADVELLQSLATNRFYTDLLVLQGQASLAAVPVPTSTDPHLGRIDARQLHIGWVVVQPTASRAVLSYLRETGFRLVVEDQGVRVFHAPL